jgi:4-methylaminobutanoate oxidase (formaldehyde-forming)
MLQFKLTDPEPLLFHNEPILRDGKIVSFLTSGNYGHALGGAIGLGYVPCAPGETGADMLASSYSIDVAGHTVAAEVSLAPMYDPKSTRVRA